MKSTNDTNYIFLGVGSVGQIFRGPAEHSADGGQRLFQGRTPIGLAGRQHRLGGGGRRQGAGGDQLTHLVSLA